MVQVEAFSEDVDNVRDEWDGEGNVWMSEFLWVVYRVFHQLHCLADIWVQDQVKSA